MSFAGAGELRPTPRTLTQDSLTMSQVPPYRPAPATCEYCRGTLGYDSAGTCQGCGAPRPVPTRPNPPPSRDEFGNVRLQQFVAGVYRGAIERPLTILMRSDL